MAEHVHRYRSLRHGESPVAIAYCVYLDCDEQVAIDEVFDGERTDLTKTDEEN